MDTEFMLASWAVTTGRDVLRLCTQELSLVSSTRCIELCNILIFVTRPNYGIWQMLLQVFGRNLLRQFHGVRQWELDQQRYSKQAGMLLKRL